MEEKKQDTTKIKRPALLIVLLAGVKLNNFIKE